MKNLFIGMAALSTLFSMEVFAKSETQVIDLAITDKGYEPKEISVKPGVPVVLKVTRKTDSTCATQIQVPSKKVKKELPLNKTIELALGSLQKGEIRFGCGMGMMMGGVILVN